MFKLNCPHCAKTVEVSPSLAGQTTVCPLCGGPFTVPVPPASAPYAYASSAPRSAEPIAATSSSSPSASSAGPARTESEAKPIATSTEPPAFAGGPSPLPPYSPRTDRILPKLDGGWLPWVAPVGLVVVFLLLFFPWIGVYCGSTTLVEQRGIGLAFGSLGGPQVIHGFTEVASAPLMILFFLISLAGLLLGLALILLPFLPPDLVNRAKPWPERLLEHRTILMLSLNAALLVILILHLFVPYPLESASAGEKAVILLLEGLKQKVDGSLEVKKGGEELVALQWTRRTGWHVLVFLVSLVTTGAALLDWAMSRPGVVMVPVLRIDWRPVGAVARSAGAQPAPPAGAAAAPASETSPSPDPLAPA